MNKYILLLVTMLVLSTFAFSDKSTVDGTIDFNNPKDDVNYGDYYIANGVIAVDSTSYSWEKDFQFIDVPICKQWARERINGTMVDTTCENWDTEQVLDKIVLAKLEIKSCNEGSWYRIYKHDDYIFNKKQIQEEGTKVKDIQCSNNKLVFEIDSFSSYTSEEIDALQAGIIAYYSFDDADLTGSDPNDISANSFDGTNIGTATTGVAGIAGEAFNFDGTNDYIDLSNDVGLVPYQEATISQWIKLETTPFYDMIFTRGDVGTGGSYEIRMSGTSLKIDCAPNEDASSSNGISHATTDNDVIVLNTLHHVVCVINKSATPRVKIYIDGSLVNSTINPDKFDNLAKGFNQGTDKTEIGARVGAYPFDGTIDEVAFYDRALTSDEVLSLNDINTQGYNIYNYPVDSVIVNTSYLGIPINVSDFSFSSTTDFLFESFQFNTSDSQTNLGFLSSFDLLKTTGGTNSDVSMRVDIDNITIFDNVIRTVTKNELGVSGILPLLVNVSNGAHTLDFYTKRTGNGVIEVSNVDMSLGQFVSTQGNLGRGNLTLVNTSFSSTSFTNIFSKDIDRITNTSTFIAGTFSFYSTGATEAVCQILDGGYSPYFLVDLPGGVTRTIATNYITEPPSINNVLNITCKSSTGESVDITGTFIEADMADNAGNPIGHASATNSSTNYTNTVDLGQGHHDYLQTSYIPLNGTNVLISGSISFDSQSGDQTPEFHINVSDSLGTNLCYFSKERFSGGDIGNVFFYPICENMIVGENYSITMGVNVPTGETIRIYDESFSFFENTPFNIEITNLPPLVFINSPIDSERIQETYLVEWNSIDLQGDRFIQNLTLFNGTNSYSLLTNVADTIQNYSLDTTSYADGLYSLNISVCENETSDLYCNSNEITINITQVVYPIITIHEPVNGATYVTSPISLDVSANEAISEWNYTLNGVPQGVFIPNTTFEINSSGSYTVVVYGTGLEGIGSANSTFTYIASSGGGGITDEQLAQIVGANAMDDIWLILICILLGGILVTMIIKD